MFARTVLIAFALVAFSTLGQNTEEQRKYVFPRQGRTLRLDTLDVDGIRAYTHATYTYHDIYLDTEELGLYESGYSLRFRKREMPGAPCTYALQLKSEMKATGDIRMEVDESELELYKLQTDTGWAPLPTVLDFIFEEYQNPAQQQELSKSLLWLEDWLVFKLGGAVTPLQALESIRSRHLRSKDLLSLHAVLIGTSVRTRSHLYLEDSVSTGPRKSSDEFFLSNPNLLHVMESSLDSSSFLPLGEKSQVIQIHEFEVENKCKEADNGTRLMNLLEDTLMSTFGLESLLDSKYRQCIKLLTSNN